MARFGQGVMPQLGATDYIPFMQGSIRGSESVARGIEALGAGIGQGIQQYQQNKMLATQAVADFEGAAQADPRILQAAQDPNAPKDVARAVAKLQKDGSLGVRDASMLSTWARSWLKQQGEVAQREQMAAQQQAAMAERLGMQTATALMASGAPDVLGQMSRMGAPLTPGVARFISEQQAQSASTAKTRAEADALRNKRPDLSFQEQAVQAAFADFEAQTGRKPNQGEIFGIYQTVAQMSKPQTSISVGATPGEYEKTVGKTLAERDVSLFETAQRFGSDTQRLVDLSQVVASGDINTGIFAELQTNVDRLLAKAAEDKKAGRRASNDQIVDAMLGSDVFPMIGALGIGARGLDTPAERDFLLSVYSGTRKMDPAAIQELARIRYNVSLRAANKLNKELEAGRMKKFQEVYGAAIAPVEMEFGALEISMGVTISEWAYMTPEEREIMAEANKRKGRR